MKLLGTGESVKRTDIVFTHIKLIISRGMSKIHFVASGHRPQRNAEYNKPILYYGIMVLWVILLLSRLQPATARRGIHAFLRPK